MKKILSLALALTMCFSLSVPAFATSGESNFTDVASNAYYADSVAWAVSKGITSGTSANTFSPDQTCSTAQILTFLWRAHGSPAPTISNPFSDITTGAYYEDAAIWSYEKGLISGSTFNGNAPATRAAAVTYLWKLAGSPSASATNFTDVPNSASYAQAVAWAVAEGITSGTSTSTFSPDKTCTRGQIVTFLYRDLADPSSEGKGLEYYGLEPTAVLDKAYSYTTYCRDNTGMTTTGTVKFTDYTRKSLGNGYDELSVNVVYTFSDSAANAYGYSAKGGAVDYYLYNDDDTSISDSIYEGKTIEWNGMNYTECSSEQNVISNDWNDDIATVVVSCTAKVPAGYDGYVVLAYAIPADMIDADYVSLLERDNLIMFRCS